MKVKKEHIILFIINQKHEILLCHPRQNKSLKRWDIPSQQLENLLCGSKLISNKSKMVDLGHSLLNNILTRDLPIEGAITYMGRFESYKGIFHSFTHLINKNDVPKFNERTDGYRWVSLNRLNNVLPDWQNELTYNVLNRDVSLVREFLH
jgi:hypothetical protein